MAEMFRKEANFLVNADHIQANLCAISLYCCFFEIVEDDESGFW